MFLGITSALTIKPSWVLVGDEGKMQRGRDWELRWVRGKDRQMMLMMSKMEGDESTGYFYDCLSFIIILVLFLAHLSSMKNNTKTFILFHAHFLTLYCLDNGKSIVIFLFSSKCL